MTLHGAELANPALFEDLESHRMQIRKIYAPLLWDVIGSLRATNLDGISQKVATDLFHRLAREALWAITEIRDFDELKYFSQRYISEDVHTRWAALTKAGVKDKYRYYRNTEHPKRPIDIRHEHVVPRDHLKKALAASGSLEETTRILERPVSCVVSCDEDHRLPQEGNGWERYIKASPKQVRVFDRSIQDWADLEALASAQR